MSTYELGNALRNQKGSVLVGVVAITIILSIGAITYAALVRNTGTNEMNAYWDAKAYYVAEQGARIADNYLSDGGNWKELANKQVQVDDDIDCFITVKITNGSSTDPVAEIESRAVTSRLPYDKVVTLKVPGKRHESFAGFVNGGADFDMGGSVGLQRGTLFVGPVHFNSPIMLSKRSFTLPDGNNGSLNQQWQGARFQGGTVSVYNRKDRWDELYDSPEWYTDFDGGQNGDYSFGVAVAAVENVTNINTAGKEEKFPGKPKGEDLDRVFRAGFNPNGKERKVVFDDGSVLPANKKNLGTVTGATGTAGNLTVDITFYDDNTYKVGTGAKIPYSPTAPTIIYAKDVSGTQYHVNIKGSAGTASNGDNLAGKVTVVTEDKRDIIIDMTAVTNNRSFLTYKGVDNLSVTETSNVNGDFYQYVVNKDQIGDAANRDGGLDFGGKDNGDIFAFYSDNDIIIKTPNIAQTVASIQPLITAQLIAKNGTLKMEMATGTNKQVNAKVHVVGSVMMNKWFETATVYTETQGNLRTYYDKRRDNYGFPIMGPGFSVRVKKDDVSCGGNDNPYIITNPNNYCLETEGYIGRGGAGGGQYKWGVENRPKNQS